MVGSCTRSTPGYPAAIPPPGIAPARASHRATSIPPPLPRVDTAPRAAPADPAPSASGPTAIDGPHEIALAPGRTIYYARPVPSDAGAVAAGAPPWRLVGHLHGVCGAPSYAAGKWLTAGIEQGVVVAPTGNAKCNDEPLGAPSWEAATWSELVTTMDRDLEKSVARVEAKHPGSIRTTGAILTGYSRGAYAAAVIARAHPNRWPYLVLIEANVPLDATWLRKAGVRAVSLVAGERSQELPGERKSEAALSRAGFPAKLVIMKGAAHLYSDDMEDVMRAALAFVLSHEEAEGAHEGSLDR